MTHTVASIRLYWISGVTVTGSDLTCKTALLRPSLVSLGCYDLSIGETFIDANSHSLVHRMDLSWNNHELHDDSLDQLQESNSATSISSTAAVKLQKVYWSYRTCQPTG